MNLFVLTSQSSSQSPTSFWSDSDKLQPLGFSMASDYLQPAQCQMNQISKLNCQKTQIELWIKLSMFLQSIR